MQKQPVFVPHCGDCGDALHMECVACRERSYQEHHEQAQQEADIAKKMHDAYANVPGLRELEEFLSQDVKITCENDEDGVITYEASVLLYPKERCEALGPTAEQAVRKLYIAVVDTLRGTAKELEDLLPSDTRDG